MPRKIDTGARNIFKRDLNINPKFKKFIESKLQKGIKLHSEFLEKANIISSKNSNLNLSYISSVRPHLANPKTTTSKARNPSTTKKSQIYIKDDQNPMVISSITNLASPSGQASRNEGRKSLVKSRESFLSNPQQPNSCLAQQQKFPMSAAQALKCFMNEMSEHETGEILDYKVVYYLGQNAEKIKGSILKDKNYGYDDESGDYKIVINDHIAYRYGWE